MPKVLKFRPNLVEQVLSGTKNCTWRLFDDKALRPGDHVDLVDWSTGHRFATAVVTEVRTKPFHHVDESDLVGHEKFESHAAMVSTYQEYYGSRFRMDAPLTVVRFRLVSW